MFMIILHNTNYQPLPKFPCNPSVLCCLQITSLFKLWFYLHNRLLLSSYLIPTAENEGNSNTNIIYTVRNIYLHQFLIYLLCFAIPLSLHGSHHYLSFMQLLGWMHRKFRQNSNDHEPPKEFSIGKYSDII